MKTEVKFLQVDRSDFKTFTGTIGARFPCRSDRDVTLWYKSSEDAPQQKLDTDDTNKKGKFVFELDSMAIAGLYGASVSKLFEVEDGDRFLCKPVKPVFLSF